MPYANSKNFSDIIHQLLSTESKLDYEQQVLSGCWLRTPGLLSSYVLCVSQHCAYRARETRNKILFWCVTYVLSSIIFMLFLPAEFCNASPGTASQSHFKIRFKLQASLWLPLFLTERRPTHNLTNEILPVSAEILYRCWQRTTLSTVGKMICPCFLRDMHIKAFLI